MFHFQNILENWQRKWNRLNIIRQKIKLYNYREIKLHINALFKVSLSLSLSQIIIFVLYIVY